MRNSGTGAQKAGAGRAAGLAGCQPHPHGSGILQPGPCHRGQPEQLGADPLLQGAGSPAEQVKRSKPDPEIFLLAAEKLGTAPARTLVLEDSYNGVRAGAAGGFVTVMVPDLAQPDDEMRRLYTAECASLHEVRRMLEEGRL